ncbi:ATRX [Lepeophtheirus salmonis]|uniref:ATRX n=1 Tax=Lepeophtheirus salmonis TaxID=72036 RepID=A0A7R8D2K4_LEPSM|nr:ATRX [Lepeophtheirus salmonis]CAF3006335.1 ATRX [Lepeophtheirus salmonis]
MSSCETSRGREADVKEAGGPLESTEDEPQKAEISSEALNTPDSTEAINTSSATEVGNTPDPTEVLTTSLLAEAPNLREDLNIPNPTEVLNTPELGEIEGEVEKEGEGGVAVGLSAVVEKKEEEVDGKEKNLKEKDEDVSKEKSMRSCVIPSATVSAASKVTKKLPCSSVTVTISVSKKESEVMKELNKKEESSKDDIIVLGSKKLKPLNDEEWFLKLSDDELTWYRENGPHSSYFEHKTIQCTGCSSQILNTGQDQVFRHPSLGVAICKGCKNYYQNGEWTKDEDGYDVYCRWCGNGGDLLLCDFCTHSFCKRCIQRNLGRKKLHEICEADTWQCLLCQPSLIYYQRSIYHAFVQFQCEKSLKARKSLKKKESNIVRETFLDENITEAFKTLSIYQKCLEDERRRWLKCKKKNGFRICWRYC